MSKHSAPLDPIKMTALLRAGVLAIQPADMGYQLENCPDVLGVMLELCNPEVVVSLVTLLDGSVSVYLSDGDGVIGCGQHPDVRQAARKMMQMASRMSPYCEPVDQYPLPVEQQVRFYLLSKRGVLGAVATRTEMDEGMSELAELYYACHGVISMIELLGAGVDLIDEIHLAEAVRNRRLQLARGAPSPDEQQHLLDTEQGVQLKPRRRSCRILPYVGHALRRAQN
ncbi:MAG: hypothetical protein AB7F79_12650 [Steroidobacteraceae bacterium]